MKFAASIVLAVFLASTTYAAPAIPSEAETVAPVSSVSADASASAPLPSSSFFGSAVPSSAIATSVIASSAAATSAPASSSAVASAAPSALSSLSRRPPASSSAAAPPASATVPFAPEDPNSVLWAPTSEGTPLPQRGGLGSNILGPQDVYLDQQNPDLLAPPTTDSGTIGQAKWPFSLSHNRLQTGGWARQQNVAVMPMATEMAAVNMRLEVGAVRELHWHKTSEWAYILKGDVQVTAIDPEGRNFIGTVGPGDLWYFPAGVPHSLQATDATQDGAEFLLVFDDGAFSEDSTFLLTDWLAHVPKDVLAKNFQTDISTFSKIPGKELYIFPAPVPGPDSSGPVSPQGTVPNPFTFKMSEMQATEVAGGSVKIVDSHTFKVSTTTAVAEVAVAPGAMRELHWHPTQDEWSYILEGNARVTLFGSQGNARTYNYQAGDVGYVPGTFGHYVENIGNSTLRYLEVFKTDTFQDVSLSQWLALTPPEMVKATLNIDDEALTHFQKVKPIIVAGTSSGNSNSTSA